MAFKDEKEGPDEGKKLSRKFVCPVEGCRIEYAGGGEGPYIGSGLRKISRHYEPDAATACISTKNKTFPFTRVYGQNFDGTERSGNQYPGKKVEK